MPRKYRDERNSRRNRRWLQDEMDASGHMPEKPPLRAATRPNFGLHPSPTRRPTRRPPDAFIPFKEIAAQSDGLMN